MQRSDIDDFYHLSFPKLLRLELTIFFISFQKNTTELSIIVVPLL